MSVKAGDDILVVRDLSIRFGALKAVDSVGFDLRSGQFLAIAGPNGAGKTTLLNGMSGLVRVNAGSARVHAEDGWHELVGSPGHLRPAWGIARTFQHSKLFPGLTVIDHLLCGTYSARPRRDLRAATTRSLRMLVRTPRMLSDERRSWERAEATLMELGIEGSADLLVDQLPGPHRRLVDLGRALISNPRILLLDEIAAGTTPDEKERIIHLLRNRNESHGMTVVLIEHDLEFVRRLADEVVVLVQGEVFATGEPNDVLRQREVLIAYVGED